MPVELSEELKELDATLSDIEKVLDVDGLRAELAALEEQASDPELWSDQARAQKVTSQLSRMRADLTRVEALRVRIDDALAAVELDDPDLTAEAEASLPALTKEVQSLEVRTLLSGEYDPREAIVQLSAGAGGVDAADWTEMLLRMYLRWAERHGWNTEVLDTSYAEEAGLKSATFKVEAPFAYGTLRSEHGVHRLVRISPFDNQSRRQTSFAGRRGHAGRRERRRGRHRREGPADRHLPQLRTGRSGRQHDRLGGADHPHPDQHRRHLPERALAAAEQGGGDAGARRQAARAAASGRGR